jgi:hypothetical protein
MHKAYHSNGFRLWADKVEPFLGGGRPGGPVNARLE